MSKFRHIEDYVFSLPNWMQKHFYTVQNIILTTNDAIVESIKYNCAFYSYMGNLCYLSVFNKKHFVLGFCAGKYLLDEENILQANQGQTTIKHWPLEPNKPIKTDLLNAYIHEALLINEFLYNQKKKNLHA